MSQAPARIRNVAELGQIAGVSAGTVSRALADNPLVNEKTRERIKALAEKHGFRPNQMARKLRTQQTGVIGVVVPLGHEKRQHLSDPFFMAMLAHLADALTDELTTSLALIPYAAAKLRITAFPHYQSA